MAFAAPACGGSGAAVEGSCEEGEEGCGCFGNDTCNGGLKCFSDICVDPNSSSSGGASAAGADSGGAANGGAANGGTANGGTANGGSGNGGGVTLSGRVMAPSGDIPIAGALVSLTHNEVEPIPAGVYNYQCDDMAGTGYALSRADGTWTIKNATPGAWKLVTRKGSFRRVRGIDVTTGMDPKVAEDMTALPAAHSADGQDTIPSFAVVKTSPDLTYNLLAKFGLGQVDASGVLVDGTARFHIYEDNQFPSGTYPATTALFDSQSRLNSYHMIFLPCFASQVGVSFVNSHVEMLRDYVAAGGKVYNSCTASLWTEAPFPEYIEFFDSDEPTRFDIGRRTSSDYTTMGAVLDPGLAAWLSVVSQTDPNNVPFYKGYVTIDQTVNVDDGHGLPADGGVVKPYTWVRDNGTYPGSPLMVSYNFDFGKVLYSVYESSAAGVSLTAQDYVLLYTMLEMGVCPNLPTPSP